MLVEALESTLNLTRLPKPPKKLKSLNYKGTTPGESAGLFHRYANPFAYKPLNPALARTVSALSKSKALPMNPWSFPKAGTAAFVVNIVPKSLLNVRPLGKSIISRSKAGRADMSITTIIPKKVHRHAVVRSRIRFRLKEALGLIVTRGAEGIMVDGKLKFNEEDIGAENWILPDWSYIFIPKLDVFNMPLEDMISDLREVLTVLKKRGLTWEHLVYQHCSDTKKQPNEILQSSSLVPILEKSKLPAAAKHRKQKNSPPSAPAPIKPPKLDPKQMQNLLAVLKKPPSEQALQDVIDQPMANKMFRTGITILPSKGKGKDK